MVCDRMICFRMIKDHYGGLAATDELARGGQITSGTRVADFCAGLGGTVRYLAHKYGAHVTGIELTPSRVAGAQELTQRVRLQDRAQVIEGNVMSVPLGDGTMDAVISQEAFCHIPDPEKAPSEAFRILRKVACWPLRIGSPISSFVPMMLNFFRGRCCGNHQARSGDLNREKACHR